METKITPTIRRGEDLSDRFTGRVSYKGRSSYVKHGTLVFTPHNESSEPEQATVLRLTAKHALRGQDHERAGVLEKRAPTR